jgi:hypothetical protein
MFLVRLPNSISKLVSSSMKESKTKETIHFYFNLRFMDMVAFKASLTITNPLIGLRHKIVIIRDKMFTIICDVSQEEGGTRLVTLAPIHLL